MQLVAVALVLKLAAAEGAAPPQMAVDADGSAAVAHTTTAARGSQETCEASAASPPRERCNIPRILQMTERQFKLEFKDQKPFIMSAAENAVFKEQTSRENMERNSLDVRPQSRPNSTRASLAECRLLYAQACFATRVAHHRALTCFAARVAHPPLRTTSSLHSSGTTGARIPRAWARWRWVPTSGTSSRSSPTSESCVSL